jgi:hypothetical protein
MSRTLRMGKYFGDDGSAGYQTRRRAAYNSRTVRSVMPMNMTSEAAVTEFRFSSIATLSRWLSWPGLLLGPSGPWSARASA